MHTPLSCSALHRCVPRGASDQPTIQTKPANHQPITPPNSLRSVLERDIRSVLLSAKRESRLPTPTELQRVDCLSAALMSVVTVLMELGKGGEGASALEAAEAAAVAASAAAADAKAADWTSRARGGGRDGGGAQARDGDGDGSGGAWGVKGVTKGLSSALAGTSGTLLSAGLSVGRSGAETLRGAASAGLTGAVTGMLTGAAELRKEMRAVESFSRSLEGRGEEQPLVGQVKGVQQRRWRREGKECARVRGRRLRCACGLG